MVCEGLPGLLHRQLVTSSDWLPSALSAETLQRKTCTWGRWDQSVHSELCAVQTGCLFANLLLSTLYVVVFTNQSMSWLPDSV